MSSEKFRKIICEKKWVRLLLLLLSGVLMALPLVFPFLGFIGWVGLVPGGAVLLVMAADPAVRLRRMYGYGFLYFMSFYSVGFHWFIAMYPLSFVEGMSRFEAMAVVLVATFGLSALQASVSAFFGVLLALISRKGVCKDRPWLLTLTAAVMYPLFEWAQTFTWAGVPWSRLAAGQVEATAILKNVSLFGPYFLCGLIVGVNLLLSRLVLSESGRQRRICVAASALVIGVSASAGAIMLAISDGHDGEKLTAAAIQPNVSSRDPWGFNTTDTMMEILREYSLDAAEKGAKLIVWPETVFPINFYENNYISDFAVSVAKECRATVVVGAFSNGETAERNSLMFVSPEGEVSETVYSKRRLVPFGEFVPWRGLFEAVMPQLVDLLILEGDLEQSTDSNVADTDAGKLGGIICFDSIYEGLTLDSARDGAELIILSTNDSWFIGSKAVEMHASQARLRAVETGKYLVRSASTGISMIIDPNGEVLDLEGELESGYVIADVYARGEKTLYTIIGNTFSYISLAWVVLALLSPLCDKIVKKKGDFEKNKDKI